MNRFTALLIAVCALALSAPAHAANRPNTLFDQASANVAGKAINVYCSDSWTEWYNVFFASDAINGFTYLSTPVTYVSPRQCETLNALVHGEDVGSYYAATALLTLIHEAVHQRGITDEGVTDCTALPLVPGIATQFFGIPATVQAAFEEPRSKIVKLTVKGKTVRRTVNYTVIVQRPIANPYLALIVRDALRWHRAKPAAYQGGC